MGAANRLYARLRKAKMPYFALGDQVLHYASDVLDGHFRINAMLIKEIYYLDPKAFKRGIADFPNVFGPAIHAVLPADLWINGEAELGGDDHSVTHGPKRSADNFFIGERSVRLSGIKESDSAVHRLTNECDPLLFGECMIIAEIQSHAAKAN